MQTYHDIETIWLADVAMPDTDMQNLLLQTKQARKNELKYIRLQIICMLLAAIVCIAIPLVVAFKYLSSYVGLGIIFFTALAFAVVRYRQSKFIGLLNFTAPPAVLLNKMHRYYEQQKKVNSLGLLWYIAGINLGFGLYFYELFYMAPIPLWLKWVCIAVYVVWTLISVFVFGKRAAAKEYERSKTIITAIQQTEIDLL